MAKYASKDVGVLIVDGYDLRPYTEELVDDGITATLQEVTVLGDSWEAKDFVGFRTWGISTKGFYDTAALASNAALVTMNGVSRLIAWGIEGNTIGKRVSCAAASFQASFGRSLKLKEFHRVMAKFAGSGVLDPAAIILFPLGAVSGSSGNGTAVDNTAASSAGGRAYFFVTALTLGGYTNLALVVKDSADDITYAALATATVVTAAPAAESVAVAPGTVKRYLRTSHTFNGAGAAQSATVFIAFARD